MTIWKRFTLRLVIISQFLETTQPINVVDRLLIS